MASGQLLNAQHTAMLETLVAMCENVSDIAARYLRPYYVLLISILGTDLHVCIDIAESNIWRKC
jgi:hypothetical protein